MFKVNDRVQAHPGTDAWMSGDRYGSVTLVGRKWIHVWMERSQRTRKFEPDNLTVMVGAWIGMQQLKSLAREIILERGEDFIYNPRSDHGTDTRPACLYVTEAEFRRIGGQALNPIAKGAKVTPCIIGAVVSRAGFMTNEIATSMGSCGSAEFDNIWLDREVKKAALVLQNRQDIGETWGCAFFAAFGETA